MGDEKHYTIQIKGTAYRFKPVSPESLKKIAFISQMDPTGLKSFKALSMVLAESAGAEQWSQLLDRYLADELKETEFTSEVLGKLIKRQAKEASDEETPVLSSGTPTPADDAK